MGTSMGNGNAASQRITTSSAWSLQHDPEIQKQPDGTSPWKAGPGSAGLFKFFLQVLKLPVSDNPNFFSMFC